MLAHLAFLLVMDYLKTMINTNQAILMQKKEYFEKIYINNKEYKRFKKFVMMVPFKLSVI